MVRPGHASTIATSLALGLALILAAPLAACYRRHLSVAPDVLSAAPPELIDRVRSDAYNYFRLTNHEWTARVCQIFAADLPNLPVVQLHGDAHVEQYALMGESWGLDDFDDAARGPALVDIVRFLGSLDLAARRRGWSHERDRLFDSFLDGYGQGLSNPAFRPDEPDVVRRYKADTPPLSHATFLMWAEAKMEPMTDTPMKGVRAAMKVIGDIVQREHPDLGDRYFDVVRAGWLHLGIGSAQAQKVLIRIAGESTDPTDDVLLEAKAVRSRDVLPCIEQPVPSPTFRIVEGSRQVGRLKHAILIPGPELANNDITIEGQHLRDWWIRSWDASYHELDLDGLQSVDDLADIAYDSGAQLGAGALRGTSAAEQATLQPRLIVSVSRSEAQLRRAAVQLVQELLRGWRDLSGP